jgi:hypothetical protein
MFHDEYDDVVHMSSHCSVSEASNTISVVTDESQVELMSCFDPDEVRTDSIEHRLSRGFRRRSTLTRTKKQITIQV